jgi:hypothetical protein
MRWLFPGNHRAEGVARSRACGEVHDVLVVGRITKVNYRQSVILGDGKRRWCRLVNVTDLGGTVSDERPIRTTPARILQLGESEGCDLSASTTVTERIAMVALLSERMWELTGRPLPAYARGEIPVQVVSLK